MSQPDLLLSRLDAGGGPNLPWASGPFEVKYCLSSEERCRRRPLPGSDAGMTGAKVTALT